MGSDTPPYHQKAISQLHDPSLFISDAFVKGKWSKKVQTFPVVESSCTAILGNVADCDLNDFRDAIADASQAQKTFHSSTTAVQRGIILKKWNDLILSHKKDLATILSLENGKTYPEAEGEPVEKMIFLSA